jgi:hypothetical protein
MILGDAEEQWGIPQLILRAAGRGSGHAFCRLGIKEAKQIGCFD